MRLTLRTLLAYLDEVLEPEDSEELATKIRESDFASGLVHRIRNSMSRLRLSCPAPLAKGLAEDANSVGEYIDSTLPEERIADLERACLESDMHLSEVAACHQIVTWVVREPADVEPGMRQRIRDLAGVKFTNENGGVRRVDDALASLDSDSDEYAWKGGEVRPERDHKSDYMAASRRRNNAAPWIVAALAGCLVAVGFLLNSASNKNRQAQRADTPSAAAVTEAEPVPNIPNHGDFILPMTPDSSPAEGAAATTEPSLPLTLDGDLDASMEASDAPRELTPAAPRVDAGGASSLDSEFPVEPPISHEGPATAGDVEPTLVAPTASDLADSTPTKVGPANSFPLGPPGAGPTSPDSTNDNDKPGLGNDANSQGTEPDVAAAADAKAEVADDREPVDAGRFISDREVLAFWDEENAMWGRMKQRAQLALGARYRVPTAFRPQMLLGDGTQVTFAGRSEFMLSQPAEGQSPLVRISYGRAMFASLSQETNRVLLIASGQPIEVMFGDSESEFAVEVAKTLMPGVDPISGTRQQSVRIWATSGRVGVHLADQEVRAVEAGQVWTSLEGAAGQLGKSESEPAWIDSAQLSDIDRTALMKIEPMLGADRLLTLALSEASENRRQEVRAMAARCLASLERFEPLTDSLADPKQHPAWTQQFRELQAALARNPETAQRVADALRTTSGQNAESLFRMLWGYSKSQLDEGAATELLDWMEEGTLAERVLAFQNLHAATKKTLYYRPEQPLSRRKESTTQWRRQLASGQVVCQEPAPLSATD